MTILVNIQKKRISNIPLSQSMMRIIPSLFFSAMGTFLFDSRIGLLGPNPPQQSVDFIQNLQGFFRLMSPLTFNFPFYKIFPTSEWRQFQRHADSVFRIGRSFVDKVLPIVCRIGILTDACNSV